MPGMADLGRLESSTGAVSQRPVPGIIGRWPGITARLHSSMQQPNSGGPGTDATTGFSEDSSEHRQTALRLRTSLRSRIADCGATRGTGDHVVAAGFLIRRLYCLNNRATRWESFGTITKTARLTHLTTAGEPLHAPERWTAADRRSTSSSAQLIRGQRVRLEHACGMRR